MELGLNGKVAVVTGGGSGIGRATALRLGREGAAVVVADLSAERADAVAAQIIAAGGTALSAAGDASTIDGIDRIATSAENWRGPVTRLCLNAGIGGEGDIRTMSLEDWRKVFAINLESQFLAAQRFLDPMIAAGGGAIATTGSFGAFRSGHPSSTPAYGASKAAVTQLVRHLTARFSAAGVRANCICPGSVETGFGATAVGSGTMVTAPMRAPAGRRAQPEEIGDWMAFLLSDRARHLRGQVILVDGGRTAV
ncbi:SDR family NAD(P)-dependent oxidoreductase [Microbacterium sp. A93]|uniref:SDR family NAD(P)-dependent oxidoreductase n=1 Tax=Microbacterium sp. A93 TaxID=3450716 RepID=UPI003F42ABE1